MHINLDKFFKPFGKGIKMTNKDNNSQTKTSSPIWWLVSAIASVFIGSKLIIGMETVPAVLISLSIFLVLGWALQKIFGANAPVVGETKVVAKTALSLKKPKIKIKIIDYVLKIKTNPSKKRKGKTSLINTLKQLRVIN